MKRWNHRMADPGSEVEAPRVDRFLAEITWVCHRHGLSITPGDGGCFLVTEFSQDNLDWLMRANIDLEPGDLS